jgi:hypothetical protein
MSLAASTLKWRRILIATRQLASHPSGGFSPQGCVGVGSLQVAERFQQLIGIHQSQIEEPGLTHVGMSSKNGHTPVDCTFTRRELLPAGVTVARMTLDHSVHVRIVGGELS